MAELFTPRSSYGSNGFSGGSCFHCIGVNGRALSSLGNYTTHLQIICRPSNLRIKGGMMCCNASSNSRRRNPDLLRNGRQGFSRSRIQLTEERERDGFDNFDDSDMLLLKNGPLLSDSGNLKSAATSLPGPKEKEIFELFRKVQAQLRERAAMKDEKKLESTGGKGNESETVDSLLKLLRKHSTERSRRNGVPSEENRYYIPSNEEKPQSSFGPNSSSIPQEQHIASLSRPPSKFRRVSPVPRLKYKPINIAPLRGDDNSSIHAGINETSVDMVERVQELSYEALSIPEMEIEPAGIAASDTTNYEVLETELLESDVADDETGDVQEAEDGIDLTVLKLVELRAIAKTRGVKGFSKMKKSDLLELLKEN